MSSGCCYKTMTSRSRTRPPAFAVTAIGELVAKPAGAAGVAVVPAHRDLVLGTPAWVVVVRVGQALGFWRLGRRGGLLRAVAVCTGGLRLGVGRRGGGGALVERPSLGLALRLGLLAGSEVGFAAVQ